MRIRLGRSSTARARLLEWLEAYLERRGVSAAPVWKALRREQFALRSPRLHRQLERLRRVRQFRGPAVARMTAATPLVSVVMPFLDGIRFLPEAIDSVVTQTYPEWELLLVDDGSTDGSSALARDYARGRPDRIRYLEHAGHANRGKSTSRNLGIARGTR